MKLHQMKQYAVAVVLSSVALFAPSAFATSSIDVSALTASLTDALAAVGTVGGAVLAIVGLIAAFRFVRRAA